MMTIAFYTVFRADPQHMLHATALVRDIRRVMPGAGVVQLTDDRTGVVPGVGSVIRRPHGPMQALRMEHYAHIDNETMLLDTDTSIRADVQHVFDDPHFDVALTDRHWPHLQSTLEYLHTMPFNTGVSFVRRAGFWRDVLDTWLTFPASERDWVSEQRAAYRVVRSGKYRVKILPGHIYNYPPASPTDASTHAAIWHYKGPRKAWLTTRAYEVLGTPQRALVHA